jgi:hypothetical protein
MKLSWFQGLVPKWVLDLSWFKERETLGGLSPAALEPARAWVGTTEGPI